MPFNLPIFLTWLRVATIPLVVGIFYLPESWLDVHEKNLWATIFFVGAAITDWLDGYLARKHGITRSGAFLDPLADKILVLGAMFTLVSRDVFWVVPVLIIAAREIGVSLYRVFVGSKGVSMPASKTAKVKTVSQQLAVGFALAPFAVVDQTWTFTIFMWIAVALTLLSAAQYAVKALR